MDFSNFFLSTSKDWNKGGKFSEGNAKDVCTALPPLMEMHIKLTKENGQSCCCWHPTGPYPECISQEGSQVENLPAPIGILIIDTYCTLASMLDFGENPSSLAETPRLPKSIWFNFRPIKIAFPLCGWRNEKTSESIQCAGLSDKGELASLPEKWNVGGFSQ
ncbi:hypothetical protein CEXT_61451 [Caerostris extrusa]|uniref:Uncharacterized protein n=1 Tax=Caerostris extrusa TaxID=172846 RepID=A0AAV4MH77_CAEEX|nr:hypothetical protein CEXT_61451 [Caerostris extrusa]